MDQESPPSLRLVLSIVFCFLAVVCCLLAIFGFPLVLRLSGG